MPELYFVSACFTTGIDFPCCTSPFVCQDLCVRMGGGNKEAVVCRNSGAAAERAVKLYIPPPIAASSPGRKGVSNESFCRFYNDP